MKYIEEMQWEKSKRKAQLNPIQLLQSLLERSVLNQIPMSRSNIFYGCTQYFIKMNRKYQGLYFPQ